MVNAALMEGLWIGFPEGVSDRGTARGTCAVAAKDGKIVGGDLQYHFAGTYRFDGDRIIVEVTSTHYAGEPLSIWGWSDGAALTISGFFDPAEMTLGGHFEGNPRTGETRVHLRKLTAWER
jgi:hypothetical protein